MDAFQYVRAADAGAAIAKFASEGSAALLAGGTGLVDLMRLGVQRPNLLVDINRLPQSKIDAAADTLTVGALARNTALAYAPLVLEKLPALSQAILAGASPQIRNVATVGGNLMQKTRCWYFRDGASPCNKREPGSGCAAIDGFNRIAAVLGTSDKCIATHPSDMCVALAAFDATIVAQGPSGERRIPIAEFHVAYGDDPAKETTLARGELITAVEIKLLPWYRRSHYLKARDRESYEFALAAAAVALDIDGGVIRAARVALGGVASKPWRSGDAEAALAGQKPDAAAFKAAAEAALKDAVPRRHNEFKVELAKRTIVRALTRCAAIAI